MSQIQISLDAETVNLLDQAVAKSAWSRDQWLKEAISNYTAYEESLRREVEKGLEDIEAGRVIPNEQVEAEADALLAALSMNRDV